MPMITSSSITAKLSTLARLRYALLRHTLLSGLYQGLLCCLALLWLTTMAACDQTAGNTSYDFTNPLDPGPDPQVQIIWVSHTRDILILLSADDNIVNLGNWRLETDNKADDPFTFPSFTLHPGDLVYVHIDTGTSDTINVYTGGVLNGLDDNDTLILKNASGDDVDRCSSGENCWDN